MFFILKLLMIHIINLMKEMVQQSLSANNRRNTHKNVADNLDYYRFESEGVIKDRIKALDAEWDVERSVQLNASLLALSGVALGAALGKKWLIIPAAVCSLFAVQAIKGGSLPIARKLRTRKQIVEEQCGLSNLLKNGSYKNLDSNNF